MEAPDLTPEEALTLTVRWGTRSTGPDLDTVLATSAVAFPLIWQAFQTEESLVILGELRRYALLEEPSAENHERWRDDWRQVGLADVFFPPMLERPPVDDERAFEDPAALPMPRTGFQFHFAAWRMHQNFIDYRAVDIEDLMEDNVDGEPVSPMPPLLQRPPRCVVELHSAIEELYTEYVRMLAGRQVSTAMREAMEEAYDRICDASDELFVLLATVHEPFRAGVFIQAIRDSFEPPYWETDKEVVDAIETYCNFPGGDHYDDFWDWKELKRVGIPYFRKAVKLMTQCWPYVDPEEEVYAPASLASALTGLTLVKLNRLSQPGGPVRMKRPSANRRLIHLGDVAKHMKTENPHI